MKKSKRKSENASRQTNKKKWICNTPKSKGVSKSGSKREVSSDNKWPSTRKKKNLK